MEILPVKLLPKWKLALESAVRTFIQAALPVAGLSWEASGHQLDKAVLIAALSDGAAAGLAAVYRLAFPVKTDAVGVGVK